MQVVERPRIRLARIQSDWVQEEASRLRHSVSFTVYPDTCACACLFTVYPDTRALASNKSHGCAHLFTCGSDASFGSCCHSCFTTTHSDNPQSCKKFNTTHPAPTTPAYGVPSPHFLKVRLFIVSFVKIVTLKFLPLKYDMDHVASHTFV